MDVVLYWFWVLAQFLAVFLSLRICIWLIFLIVERIFGVEVALSGFSFFSIAAIRLKTSTSNIEIDRLWLSLIKSRSGFVCVHIGCIKGQLQSNTSSSKRWPPSHVFFTLLKYSLKVFQITINKMKITRHYATTVNYVDVININNGITIKTIRSDNESNIIIDINKLQYDLWMSFKEQDGTPYCLMEMATSLSILINPKCIQLLITSIDIKFEAVSVSHLMLRFNTLSGSNTNTEQPNTVQANTERPKKVEVLVTQSKIQYLSSINNRLLQVSTEKLSFNFDTNTDNNIYNVTANIKDVRIKPTSSSECIVQLKQFFVNLKFQEQLLNININMSSIKSHIDNGEVLYWYKQLLLVYRPSNKGGDSYKLPNVAMVITIDISDWLMSIMTNNQLLCSIVVVNNTIRSSLLCCDHNGHQAASVSSRFVNCYVVVPNQLIKDNSKILPSSEIHHKGRVLSIGSITINIATQDLINYSAIAIEVSGQSWIIDICESSVDLVTQVIKIIPNNSNKSKVTIGFMQPSLLFELHGLNVFIPVNNNYSIMLRNDSICMSSSEDYKLTVDKIVCDPIIFDTNTIQCVSVDNHPNNAFGYLQQMTISIINKVATISISQPIVNWFPGIHVSILKVFDVLYNYIVHVKESLMITIDNNVTTINEYNQWSDKILYLLHTVPYNSIHMESDEMILNISLDSKRANDIKISIVTGHCNINKHTITADIYQILTIFDQNYQILLLEGLQACYPNNSSDDVRKLFDRMIIKNNPALYVLLLRTEVSLYDNYKFYNTYEKLMNIRKFVFSTKNESSQKLLPIDLVVEIEEIVFQIEDSPMEVKIRANYELMSDEAEQRYQRQLALDKRLDDIRTEQGRLFSVKISQNLMEKLANKNDSIYCQRAKDMYYNEPLPTELLIVNISQLRLVIMSDSSLYGRDNLINNIKEIDSISPISDNYNFSTLWGVYISGKANHIQVHLRDYPWKLLDGKHFNIQGRLICGEQEVLSDRECYTKVIDIGPVWKDTPTITRKLPPLKYYHDLIIGSECIDVSWGPCYDPAFAQLNYAFSLITKPSLDHSPPLPWWDKCRLLIHGKTILESSLLSVNLLSTNNPYNDTEFLNVQIPDLAATLHDNVSVHLLGGLNAFVHNATRYDRCHILNISSININIIYEFICICDSHSHHSVIRCLHSKLPISAEGQQHDSYKMFRSNNMDMNISLAIEQIDTIPQILLYANTLRWLQKYLDYIRSSVSRPIRRGTIHNNVRPKKHRFTRQLRNMALCCKVSKSIIQYWSSATMGQGITIETGICTVEVKQFLKLIPYKDGLIRRPQSEWNITNCLGSVNDLAIYGGCSNQDADTQSDNNFDKRIIAILSNITYIRENTDNSDKTVDFRHKLKTNGTRIVWSEFNRDVVYKLLNSYNLYKKLKRDLSGDSLKFVFEKKSKNVHENVTDHNTIHKSLNRHNSGCEMLDKLLSDICNTLVTASDESSQPSDPKLKGIVAANNNDVIQHNWFIDLLQSQIALQGVEKKGYIICTSYITQVFGQEHAPQLRGCDPVTKNSWIAKVQDLQYFSSAIDNDTDYIPWLPLSIIQPPGANNTEEQNDIESLLKQLGPDLVHPIGIHEMMTSRPPGEAIGGIITVRGVANKEHITSNPVINIQRIASRCHCQIFYVNYGDVVKNDNDIQQSKENSDAVDTFTFRYPLAEVATTSFQYSLIVDIINNLLLYKEPRRKESTVQHARLKFMLQLGSLSEHDMKKQILAKQNKIRQILVSLKLIENDLYEGTNSVDTVQRLQQDLSFIKEELIQSSVELSAMIRAFKERLYYKTLPSNGQDGNLSAEITRRIEVWVDDAQWCLMSNDGQLQVSEIRITNCSYNRTLFSDDSGEHRFELGSFRVKNCMPNTPIEYLEVVSPYDPASRRLRVDKNVSLRIYCRDQTPVAGISVTEHLELNIIPLSVKLTERFYNTLQEFFLPKDDIDTRELTHDQLSEHSNVLGVQPTYSVSSDCTDGTIITKSSSVKLPHNASSHQVPKEGKKLNKKSNKKSHDDVEIMKNRALKMKTFIYVKFPQTSLCITYRGEGITVKEIHDHIVTIPTLEYHNLNVSWRVLLLEVKKDYKNAIISQILKSAIGLKETDEKAGLSSPKLLRNASDILMGKVKEGKTKTKKMFTKSNTDNET